jgi:hypothetical protein
MQPSHLDAILSGRSAGHERGDGTWWGRNVVHVVGARRSRRTTTSCSVRRFTAEPLPSLRNSYFAVSNF